MRSFFFSRSPFLVGGEQELLLGPHAGGCGPGLGAPVPCTSPTGAQSQCTTRRMYPRTAGVERELAKAKSAMPHWAMV